MFCDKPAYSSPSFDLPAKVIRYIISQYSSTSQELVFCLTSFFVFHYWNQ